MRKLMKNYQMKVRNMRKYPNSRNYQILSKRKMWKMNMMKQVQKESQRGENLEQEHEEMYKQVEEERQGQENPKNEDGEMNEQVQKENKKQIQNGNVDNGINDYSQFDNNFLNP